MKKFCILFALMVVTLTISGCQSRETVGLCMRQKESHAAVWLESSLHSELKGKNYSLKVKNAGNDQSQQNQQIKELLDDDCDLLIIEPVMTAAANDILHMAQQAEVPVIFLNYAPEETVLESWDRAYYVGSDLTQPGQLQSQIIRQLPDGGDLNADGMVSYTVISGPEDHVDAACWTRDCGSGLHGLRLSEDHGDWSRQSGRQLCQRQLFRFGEKTDVIFCNSDDLALGALEALQSGEKLVGEDVYLVGIGGDRQALEEIQHGAMTGTVCPDVPGLTRCIAATAETILTGGQPEKIQLLDFMIVTSQNIEDLL